MFGHQDILQRHLRLRLQPKYVVLPDLEIEVAVHQRFRLHCQLALAHYFVQDLFVSRSMRQSSAEANVHRTILVIILFIFFIWWKILDHPINRLGIRRIDKVNDIAHRIPLSLGLELFYLID